MLWSQSVVGVLATVAVGFSPGLWTWGWYDQFLALWRLYEFAKSGMLAQTMASTDDVLLGCHHTIYQIRSFCEFIGELRWTICISEKTVTQFHTVKTCPVAAAQVDLLSRNGFWISEGTVATFCSEVYKFIYFCSALLFLVPLGKNCYNHFFLAVLLKQ